MTRKRKQSHLKLVNILVRQMNRGAPEYQTESVDTSLIYQHYEARILKIERALVTDGTDGQFDAFEIGYLLYPLIEGVARDVYGMNSRKYLNKVLGYSKREADFLITMFRNSLMHGGTARKLIYDDGEITPVTFVGSGSGTPMPLIEGERSIEYYELPDGAGNQLWVTLDRLLAHVKHELSETKRTETRSHIKRISAEKKKGNRPPAMQWRSIGSDE